MPFKSFVTSELCEIRNTEIDYPNNYPHHLSTNGFVEETTKLSVKSFPQKVRKEKIFFPCLNKEHNILGSYTWKQCLIAICVEFICNILNQFILHLSSDSFGFWCGHIMLVLIIYPVSGANMNAVMSLSLWIYEEEFNLIHTVRRWSYILIIQPFGIFCGQMLSLVLITDHLKYFSDKPIKPIKIAFAELFGTMVVIYSALHFIVSKYTRPSRDIGIQFLLFGIMIYWTMNAGKNIDGGSGGAYNPTLYLVTCAIAKYRGHTDVFAHWYCYIFPEIIGSISIVFIFKFLYEPNYHMLIRMKANWEKSFFSKKFDDYIENE